MTDRSDDERELEALRRVLRAEYRGRVEVPAAVDEALLARSRLPLARLRRRRWLRLAAPATAAAGLALLVYLGRTASDGGAGPQERTAQAPEVPDARPSGGAETVTVAQGTGPTGGVGSRQRRGDVNGDGCVNILDAFVLAKALERGGARRGEWDWSGDGRVDRADVEWVARAAVSITGGGT